MAKTQTTTTSTNKVNLGKAAEKYIEALSLLFDMVGGKLTFKRIVAALRDELSAKVYSETTAIRDAHAELKIAIAEAREAARKEGRQVEDTPQVIAAGKKYEDVKKTAYEKAIEFKSPKIPVSLIPDEDTILVRQYSYPYTDPMTGQQAYKHGDYTTLIAVIWDDLIDETNGSEQ